MRRNHKDISDDKRCIVNKRHLLVTCDLGWVREQATLRRDLERRFQQVTLAPLAKSMDGLDVSTVTDWITDPAPRYKISSDLILAHMPALQRIGSPSTGTTHIAPEVMRSDILVRCLRDVPPENLARITSSSEHTFYLFLSLLRRAKRLFSADLSEWRDDLPSFRGRQVAGMKILIFGYGRIGSNLSRYFEAFKADVTLYEPDLTKHTQDHRFTNANALEHEISVADAVFLCFHWSPENEQFFGREFLDAMRDDAYLVNTSRGENVDEEHLAGLIKGGKFAGIALDVLRGEQNPGLRASTLLGLELSTDRLIVTPHIAGASYDSERLAFEFILATIEN